MRDFDGRPVVTWWIARFAALRWPRARVRRLGGQGRCRFRAKGGISASFEQNLPRSNRRLRRVPARELIANPRNWRRHPARQAAALRGLLQEVGYADALVCGELLLVARLNNSPTHKEAPKSICKAGSGRIVNKWGGGQISTVGRA